MNKYRVKADNYGTRRFIGKDGKQQEVQLSAKTSDAEILDAVKNGCPVSLFENVNENEKVNLESVAKRYANTQAKLKGKKVTKIDWTKKFAKAAKKTTKKKEKTEA